MKKDIEKGVSYTIDLVSYKEKESAEKELYKCKKMGYKVFIVQSGKYYVLCSGDYPTKKEASLGMAKMRSIYKDCFIRRK